MGRAPTVKLPQKHPDCLAQRHPDCPAEPRRCGAAPGSSSSPALQALPCCAPAAPGASRGWKQREPQCSAPNSAPAPQSHPRQRNKLSTRAKRRCPGQALTCDPPPLPGPRPLRARFYRPGLISRGCPGHSSAVGARPVQRSPHLPPSARREAPLLAARYIA